jgi:hypothetical protein
MHVAPLFLLIALASSPSISIAETIGGNPGPAHNYVCPHADGKPALDCYFDAVQHLYTMCRNVKAIEILEFGYENSQEGVNSAKYEYCLDKQKRNMALPYQAALKEARISKQAVEGVRSLQEHWLDSLQKIRWVRGESDETYKSRLAHVYDEFKEKIEGIRTIVALVRDKTSPIAAAHAAPARSDKAARATVKSAKGAPPAKPAGTAAGKATKGGAAPSKAEAAKSAVSGEKAPPS